MMASVKALITNVTEPADKEFNTAPPTEPKFQPEKYVVSKAKFGYHRYEARWMTILKLTDKYRNKQIHMSIQLPTTKMKTE